MKHSGFVASVVISTVLVAPAALGASPLPDTAAAAKAAASPDSPALREFKSAIRAKYDMKEKAFAQHDAESIVTKFYTADVISVGAPEGIFIGRDQIRPIYQEVVRNSTVKVDSVYTYVNGDAGWDWADFHVRPTDATQKPFTLLILFLWTKENGEWMSKGEFFTSGSMREGKLAGAEAPPSIPGQ